MVDKKVVKMTDTTVDHCFPSFGVLLKVQE
jgi:hypothetical protein